MPLLMKDLAQLGFFINLIRIFFSYVFPTIFTVTGAIMMIVGAGSLQDGWDSETWPNTEGTVTHSDVRYHSSSSSQGRSSSSYTVEVEYSFSVDGDEYTGNRLRIWRKNFKRKRDAESKAKTFAPDKKVKVF